MSKLFHEYTLYVSSSDYRSNMFVFVYKAELNHGVYDLPLWMMHSATITKIMMSKVLDYEIN